MFQDQGLVIVGISMDRLAPLALQEFITEHDIRYPILLDARHEAAQMYSVRGTPTTYLINRTGQVIGGTVGPKEWMSDAAHGVIRQLLSSARSQRGPTSR